MRPKVGYAAVAYDESERVSELRRLALRADHRVRNLLEDCVSPLRRPTVYNTSCLEG